MKTKTDVTPEMQSAFVDGELGAGEWARMAERMRADDDLRRAVCDARMLKDLVRQAYSAPPRPRYRGAGRHGAGWMAIAALCLLSAGAGWLGGEFMAPKAPEIDARLLAQGALADLPGDRILVHIGGSDSTAIGTALDEVERALAAARRAARPLQIEIVANSAGIDLLRAAASPFPDRVAQLRAAYANLRFVACNQTMDGLQRRGADVALLPGVEVAPSAVEQVVKRLRDGWTYVRV